MRWTQLFIPTLREDPAEAGSRWERLLLRAGYMRRLAPGMPSYLFLGWRSLHKIAGMIREEMEIAGAREFLFPAPQAAGPWTAPEEVAAATAGGELRSYKQLPQIWYQIQRTVREEAGPRSGSVRLRQSFAHHAYSFDLDSAAQEITFARISEVLGRIFTRCGLEVFAAGTDRGTEFLAASPDGQELAIVCAGCGYAASPPTAVSRITQPAAADPGADLAPAEFHTPAIKTIEELAAFTSLPETSLIKTLVIVADGRPHLVLLRGDHQLSEAKFAAAAGAADFRPALPEELREWMGAGAGSLGPVGTRNMRVLADHALAGRRNMISGANRDDYHLRSVTPGEDFVPEYHDLRRAVAGEACSRCGTALGLRQAAALGSAARLGSRYPEAAGVRVSTADRRETVPLMGSYCIELERILSAAAERFADPDGLWLPPAIAPFQVVITPVSIGDGAQREGSAQIYRACQAAGLEVLLDDRDERPGLKFKDADLIGIPFRITVGRKLGDGLVELVDRHTREKSDIASESVAARVAERIR